MATKPDKDWKLGTFELWTRYVDGNFESKEIVEHVLGPRGGKKKRLIATLDYEPDGERILELLNTGAPADNIHEVVKALRTLHVFYCITNCQQIDNLSKEHTELCEVAEKALAPFNENSLLTEATDRVLKKHPLPRCSHGTPLKDHGGNLLKPSCGCSYKEKTDAPKNAATQ